MNKAYSARTRGEDRREKQIIGRIVRNNENSVRHREDDIETYRCKSKDLMEAHHYLNNIAQRLKEIEEEKREFYIELENLKSRRQSKRKYR